MKKEVYDVAVIGAGSGGLTAAVGFAKVGKKVLLIEREHMGGECTNTGCIPSKALIHYAKRYHTATAVAGKGMKSEAFRAGAFLYVRSIIKKILEEETPETFEKLGIDVVMGETVFTDAHTISIADKAYTFKTGVIATGSSPRMIEVSGMEEKDILTNQNIFDLKDVPTKLLVIGSGPVGMETAEACAMLGSNVTIATIDDVFARFEDPAIQPIIREKFESLDIRIITNAYINTVSNRLAHFTINKGGPQKEVVSVPYDKVLVAIGRTPNLPEGLGAAGITANEYGIDVDSQHRTAAKHIYALGDVASPLKFTHIADDTARQVVTHATSKGLFRFNNRKAVPKVTYTSPEMAQVGCTHERALQKYSADDIVRIEVPFTENDRAKTTDNTEGLLVVIARRLSGKILGAHIVGPHAGELIGVFTLAIDQKISFWKLQKTIFAYPTYSLIIKKAGDYFFATQITNLKKDVSHLFKKHILKVSVAALWIIGLLTVHAYAISTGLSSTEIALMVFNFITMTVWGPILYVAIYTVRPITFFPATALTILSGVFFGFWGGTLLTIIAANLSATLAYIVGRFFGQGFKLEESAMGIWISTLKNNAFEAVLTMRLIFLPFDGVSYAVGVVQAPFVPFLFATIVGTLLGIATFVSIGASVDVATFASNGFSFNILNPKFLFLSAVIFIVSLILSKLIKKWRAK